MNAVEQVNALKLPVGAKPGQVVLLIDLSELPQPSHTLALLPSLGYEPQLRYLETPTGLHVVAVLKDEQVEPFQTIDDEAWFDEWEALALRITPENPNQAVRLWLGRSPVA
jgi:hypothetical protein